MPERHLYLPQDPRGLIHEAYRMEIVAEDARSIFFDWAMGAAGPELEADLATLIAHYVPRAPDHPMSAVLLEGQGGMARISGRRGGRAARVGADQPE